MAEPNIVITVGDIKACIRVLNEMGRSIEYGEPNAPLAKAMRSMAAVVQNFEEFVISDTKSRIERN
jgi:hypothetical protein